MSLVDLIKEIKEKRGVEEYEVVVDLDALVDEEKTFKFKNKIHKIKPIDLKIFLLLTEAFSQLEKLGSEKQITKETIIDSYYAIISEVCDTITKKDIEEMSFVQLNALLKYLIDLLSGKSLKKKT